MLARRHKMQEGKVFEERYIAYPDGKISKWFENAIKAEVEGGIAND